MRLLHLSDLHCEVQPSVEKTRIIQALLSDINDQSQVVAFDLVVFSGDLAFSGKPDEFDAALALLLDPLAESLGLSRERFLLVPGNHDIDRDHISPLTEGGLKGLSRAEDVHNVLQPSAERDLVLARGKAWRDFRDSYYEDGRPESPNVLTSFSKTTVDGINIGLVALDSSWRATGAPNDADRGLLLLALDQCREALDAVDDCDLTIASFHHPLEWLATWNAVDIRAEFERRGAIVLFGHEHVQNPMLQTTVRGAALYGQTGCIYGGAMANNGYTIIDIDLRGQSANLKFRRWHSERQLFDVDLSKSENGILSLPLPNSPSVSLEYLPPLPTITSALAAVVQDSNLFAGPQLASPAPSINELLVEPRLLPAPYSQLAAAADFARAGRVGEQGLDPLLGQSAHTILNEGKILIIAGDSESGISSAIIWLLAAHHAQDWQRVPAYMKFELRSGLTSFDRPVREAVRRIGVQIDSASPLPPLVLGIDDVDTESERVLGRLVSYISSNPGHRYILGFHGDPTPLKKALELDGQSVAALYLGPFTRKRAKRLLDLNGSDSLSNSVDRLLDVAFGEHLPRTPFIISALAAVMIDDSSEDPPNVSTLLDSVLDLLLGKGDPLGREEGLDSRGRQHLLETLAADFIRTSSRRMPRGLLESFIGEYTRSRGMEDLSPGHILDGLLARKILISDGDGVGFRYQSLQSVLAARMMTDDRDFEQYVLGDPVVHAEVVRHAAGLRGSDRELLELVGASTDSAMSELRDRATLVVDAFDGLGFSETESDVDQQIAGHQPRDPDIWDAELEEHYERRERSVATDQQFELLEETALAGASTILLAQVLSASELVDDLPLKTRLLKAAITSMAALADEIGQQLQSWQGLRSAFDQWFPDEDDSTREQRWTMFLRVTSVLATSYGMAGILGSKALAASVRSLSDDAEIRRSATHSLYVARLFVSLGMSGVEKVLEQTYKDHSSNPLVSVIIQNLALECYFSPETDVSNSNDILNLLADIHVAGNTGTRGVQSRDQVRGPYMTKLRNQKLRYTNVGDNAISLDQIIETAVEERDASQSD